MTCQTQQSAKRFLCNVAGFNTEDMEDLLEDKLTYTNIPTTTVPENVFGIALPSDQLDTQLLKNIILCKDTDLFA